MNQVTYIEEFVKLGGIDQYVLHYPRVENGPVILFLNGGPGNAEANFGHYFREYWPACYQVVYWDQRGCGKTYSRQPKAKDYPTIERQLRDLDQLISYLQEYYKKEKIILLGHSWGTVLGSLYTLKKPENVLIYIGVAQVVDMQENERLGFEKVVSDVRKIGNKRDEQALLAIDSYPPLNFKGDNRKIWLSVRKYQMKYGLAAKVSWKLIKVIIKSPVFKWSDVTSLIKGGKANQQLIDYLITFELTNMGQDYQVPICLIHGENDYQIQKSLAVAFFKQLKAPGKQVHIIPNAGHIPMIDQPELFAKALAATYQLVDGDKGDTKK